MLFRSVETTRTAATAREFFEISVTWKTRPLGKPGGPSRGRELPRTSISVRVCRYSAERCTGRRRSVFRRQQEPHGSRGSLADPPVSGSVKHPGAQLDAVWFAQPPRARAREGTSRGESLRDDPEMAYSEGGLRESWDRGHGTRTGGLKRSGACGACDLVFLRVRGR